MSKPNMFSRFMRQLISHDSFGTSFRMKFKGGNETVPTGSGLVCTIALLAMMLMYSYQKVEILINKKDAKIFATEQISNITDT